MAAFAIGAVAAPAQANPALDCFEWVKASAAKVIHHRPHRVHHVRRHNPVTPRKVPVRAHVRPHRHIHRIASPAYLKRPIACPQHESVIASRIPGIEAPETPEIVIAELAGPPTASETAADTVATAPAPPEEEVFPPFPGSIFPPQVPAPPIGGLPTPGGPPGPGGPPPVTPPPETPPPVVGPPVLPPVGPPVTPPETPPLVPPPFVQPPVLPPGPPPESPPVISQPPVTPPAAVPEPAAWALLLTGFGALGLLARRGRRGQLGLRLGH